MKSSNALMLQKGIIVFALIFTVSSSVSYSQGNSKNIRTAEYAQLQKNLCRGWNTWNTNSVLSHVHLPEAFAVNLCIKNSGTGEPYVNSFYKANETLGRPEKIKLGSRSDDGSYTELEMSFKAFSWQTESRFKIKVQSASDGDELFLLVTVLERDKFRPPYLTVEAGTLWNRNGQITKNGDTITAKYNNRSFTLQTTAKTLPEEVRWLSMYRDAGWPGPVDAFWGRYAVLTDDPETARHWLDTDSIDMLMNWPGEPGWDAPRLFMLTRGKTYLRMQAGPPGDSTVALHALDIFEHLSGSALRLLER